MKLTRDDVTVVNDNAPWFGPAEKVWHIRIAGVDYRIIARREDTTVLAGDDAWRTAAYPSTALGYPDGADEDLQTVTSTYDPDHWLTIDRLIEWLSIDVEPNWSRPVIGISWRTDLGPAELFAMFTEKERQYTRVWTIRDLASHMESYRYDDGIDYDLGMQYPVAMYTRAGTDMVLCSKEELGGADGSVEVRIRDAHGELVAAARY